MDNAWTAFGFAFLITGVLGSLALVVQLVIDRPSLGSLLRSPEMLGVLFKQYFGTPNSVALQSLLSACVFGASAFVWTRKEKAELDARLSLQESAFGSAGLVTVVLTAIALGTAVSGATELIGVRFGVAHRLFAQAFASASAVQFSLLLAVIGVLAPLGEELFFRGYMQGAFVARWGPTKGVLAAAAVFGAMHFDLVQSPHAFVMGLFFGFLVQRHRSIRPAVVAHAANNWFSVLLGRVLPDFPPSSLRLPMLAASLVVTALGAWLLFFREKSSVRVDPA